jgi:hypothetical protein
MGAHDIFPVMGGFICKIERDTVGCTLDILYLNVHTYT